MSAQLENRWIRLPEIRATSRWEQELRRGAACRGAAQRGDNRFVVQPPHRYDPKEDWADYDELVASAKRVCDTCPVKTLCGWLGDVVEEKAMYIGTVYDRNPLAYITGIYGGESPEERLERRGQRAGLRSREVHRPEVPVCAASGTGVGPHAAEGESGAA